MRSAYSITKSCKKILLLLVVGLSAQLSWAQENSPYSRYGLGDLNPNQHITNRGMGGISAAFQNWNSANLTNPAGNVLAPPPPYIHSPFVLFDVGTEISVRALKSNISPEKFSSTNVTISYLHFGVPLTSQKMAVKKKFLAVNFGLKPVSQVSYRIEERIRNNIDSMHTLYEGEGGLNQVYLGTAYRIKNLSLGIRGGYSFGNKTISTLRGFISDSTEYYYGNYETRTTYNGLSLSAGLQYDIPTTSGLFKLGAWGDINHKLNAEKDELIGTVQFDFDGQKHIVDTVSYSKDIAGKINMPLKWGAGITFVDKTERWTVGLEYEQAMWEELTVFGDAEPTQNSYKIRMGAQYYPTAKDKQIKSYFEAVTYRLGFYYGTDPVNVEGERIDYAFTTGASFPLSNPRNPRYRPFNAGVLNTSLEFGGRGDKNNGNIREGLFRFNIGVSFTGNWFQKRKYY